MNARRRREWGGRGLRASLFIFFKNYIMHKFLSISKNINTLIWSAIVLFFTYQMLLIIWPYTTGQLDIDFLLTKQHIIHLDYYRIAFYGHIYSSLIVLLSGAFLFSKWILRNFSKLHRWIGKCYVGLVLIISAPTGMVMAYHANGGWLAQLSFLILTPLWWWFTYQGYRTVRQLNFEAHKKWMIRSYALTFSAVSLRFYQLVLGSLFYMDPEMQYILVSWISWVGNLVVVEIWSKKKSLIKRVLLNKGLPSLFRIQ